MLLLSLDVFVTKMNKELNITIYNNLLEITRISKQMDEFCKKNNK